MYSKRHILSCCIMEGNRTSLDTDNDEVCTNTIKVVNINTIRVEKDHIVGEKLTSVELIKIDSDVYISTSYFTIRTGAVYSNRDLIYSNHFSGDLTAKGQYVQENGLTLANSWSGFLFNPLYSGEFHLRVMTNFKEELGINVFSVVVGEEYILTTDKGVHPFTLENTILKSLDEYADTLADDARIILYKPNFLKEDKLDYLYLTVLDLESTKEYQYRIHAPNLKIRSIIEGNMVI